MMAQQQPNPKEPDPNPQHLLNPQNFPKPQPPKPQRSKERGRQHGSQQRGRQRGLQRRDLRRRDLQQRFLSWRHLPHFLSFLRFLRQSLQPMMCDVSECDVCFSNMQDFFSVGRMEM